MITITYLNASKQEKSVTYEDYAAFERAQLACLVNIADYYKVVKVVYDGKEIPYNDTFGNLYFFLSQLDLTAL